MPSAYLQGSDAGQFGVPNATSQQITQASVLIDAYLRRPHGLLWKADANGNPAYMTSLHPEFTLQAQGSFGPGNGVQVPVTGAVGMLNVGDCVVLDRQTPATMETVQITSISGNMLTLGTTGPQAPQGLQFAHAQGCTIESGLIITEQRYVPRKRSTIDLSHTPVARLIGGTGRYGYARRGDSSSFNVDTYNLLATLSKFGGPPAWELWPANNAAGIDASTGQLWIPAGVMLVYYSEVKVRYVAGFQYAGLPDPIKLACAQMVTAIANDPGIGNFSSAQAGDTKMERFAATNLSDDVKAMLTPWRARAFA